MWAVLELSVVSAFVNILRARCCLQGEQHGLRKAENIRSALEGEMYFYGRVLGFKASYSPELQPMTIDNLPDEDGKAAAGAPAAAPKEEL
jgi:hypothetical protein